MVFLQKIVLLHARWDVEMGPGVGLLSGFVLVECTARPERGASSTWYQKSWASGRLVAWSATASYSIGTLRCAAIACS